MSTPSAHRRDIDGLRAVAVMGVILAHAGFGFLPAGHAGVDVFFAISGYLIGGIIATDLAAGQFSFRAFYARRARRILPALLAMLLATIPLAWLLMTPHQLRYFGGAALSAVGFLSNVWFFNQIDYFNPEAANDPLVHTWSLGVEEQFYLLAPVLMLGLWRLRRGRTAVLAILAAARLAWALATVGERPQAAFYLPQFRAWELLAGVLAALWGHGLRARVPAMAANAISTLGLVAIVVAMLVVPADAAWPGPLTMLPLAGALAILVFSTPASLSGRVLALPPLVWIGLISYSAYLWHQPVLGFARIAGLAPDGTPARLAAVALTLALAAISWKWIEQPFRTRRVPPRRAGALLAGAVAVLAAFAIGGHVSKGYLSRMSPQVLAMLDYSNAWPATYRTCIGGRDEGERLDPATACLHGAPDTPAQVAIWGDSHAAVLAQPLGQALAPDGQAVRELTVGSCIPIIGLKNSALKRTEYCAVHNRLMLDYLVASPDVQVVILNAFWNSYTERRDFDTRAGWVNTDTVIALPLDGTPAMDDGARLAFMARELAEEVRALTEAGKDVVLLYALPEAGFDPPETLARRLWRGEDLPQVLGYPEAAFADYSRLSRALLDAAGQGPRVHRLDLSGAFCDPGGECRVVEGGVPLLFNENHLSTAGTAKVIPGLAEVVRGILAAKGGGG